MALATERPPTPFSKSTKEAGGFSYNGQRVFDVTAEPGDTIPLPFADAYAAVIAKGADFDEPYDDDIADATVTGLTQFYNKTAGMWTFTFTYGDGFGGDGFLTQPPEIEYDGYFYTEYRDYDAEGRPYTNSVGTPFVPPLDYELPGCIITVRRPMANYPASIIFTHGGAVNSLPLNLPDGNVVPAGCAKFIPPKMASRSTDAANMWVAFRFDARPAGWNKHPIDQGAEAYATWGDSGKKILAPIVTEAAGGGAAGLVLLNGAGKPIKSSVFKKVSDVSGNRFDIIAPPAPVPASQSVKSPPVADGGLTTYTGGESGMVVFDFPRNKRMDLNSLLTS